MRELWSAAVGRPGDRFLALYAGFLLVQLAIASAIPTQWPNLVWRFNEDRAVENATVGLFILAAVAGVYAALRFDLARRLAIICAVLGTLGALDEIGFGERLFSLPMPVVLEMEIDGVHDFLELALRAIELSPFVGLAIVVLVVGVTAYVAWRRRDALARATAAVRSRPWYGAFCAFVVLVGVSLFLDVAAFLGLVRPAEWRPDLYVMIFEELLELNAAFCLLLTMLFVARAGRSTAGTPSSGPG